MKIDNNCKSWANLSMEKLELLIDYDSDLVEIALKVASQGLIDLVIDFDDK